MDVGRRVSSAEFVRAQSRWAVRHEYADSFGVRAAQSSCSERPHTAENALYVLVRAIPLLDKGGVAARPRKFREATLTRADGVVRSSHRLIGS